jgi:hypothetical protein
MRGDPGGYENHKGVVKSAGNSKSREGLRKRAEQYVDEGQAVWECGSRAVKQDNTGVQLNGRKRGGSKAAKGGAEAKGVGKRVVKVEEFGPRRRKRK